MAAFGLVFQRAAIGPSVNGLLPNLQQYMYDDDICFLLPSMPACLRVEAGATGLRGGPGRAWAQARGAAPRDASSSRRQAIAKGLSIRKGRETA